MLLVGVHKIITHLLCCIILIQTSVMASQGVSLVDANALLVDAISNNAALIYWARRAPTTSSLLLLGVRKCFWLSRVLSGCVWILYGVPHWGIRIRTVGTSIMVKMAKVHTVGTSYAQHRDWWVSRRNTWVVHTGLSRQPTDLEAKSISLCT